MQIVKTNKKLPFYENHEDKKLDCLCGYTGRHVYFELCFFLFSHARIGLLIVGTMDDFLNLDFFQ